jgi:hypothetical protein
MAKRLPDEILRFQVCERHLHWAIAIPVKLCFVTALVLVHEDRLTESTAARAPRPRLRGGTPARSLRGGPVSEETMARIAPSCGRRNSPISIGPPASPERFLKTPRWSSEAISFSAVPASSSWGGGTKRPCYDRVAKTANQGTMAAAR